MGAKELERIRALFLAGHPALDFLNTRMSVDGNLVELLQSDEDVHSWLKQAGFPASTIDRKLKPLHLLRSARTLRENIRSLVEGRKRGKSGDPSILNKFLAAGSRYSQLVWSKSNKLRIETVRRQKSAESILAPIAEAAADLLTTGNFDLVKHCENQTCLLWFLDQTKSHRRRWCSMERCGNRYKVAAYRARRRDQNISS
ncbi:putative RNA-binding Zn ribbon-like protein [Silvibacterium bohemicum]|uniref:Putative RNA-binding Zn ribbon-like protein n=1 Tax=Silvibacterium bohemicum TaxID=1577686 RepID=A0A841JRP9_9BACT|nr:ABATE domain-containing protein [Silvibacterium bohemicum]MBB6143197.1 putative RNA-binding Zn ribbon-like protein [Silvibacterium bohemicum]